MRLVVKLFNTIQQSQLAAATAEEEAKASRGTGKPSLPTPSLDRKDKGKKKNRKNNISGTEKHSEYISGQLCLWMIRSINIHARYSGQGYLL